LSSLPTQLAGSLSQAAGIPVQLGSALGSVSGALGQAQQFAGQVSGAIGQVQNLAQSPQQVLQSFSGIMSPQTLDFQSQYGQLQNQLAPARDQISAAARSSAAATARAGGEFASQTPSALAPTSSIRPQQRPINTQSAGPVARPPTRPGQNVSGQAAIDQRRAQRIDSQQGNFGA
jgi:hypothetical protein